METMSGDFPQPLLHIWKVENEKFVKMYTPDEPDPKMYDFRCKKFVLSDLSRLPPTTDDIDLSHFPDAEKRGLILVDGITLRLLLTWTPPQYDRHGTLKWEMHTHLSVRFGNIKSPRVSPKTESELGKLRDMVGKEQDFLVLIGTEIDDHPARRDGALFFVVGAFEMGGRGGGEGGGVLYEDSMG